jgi:hypothetical protein
LDRKTRHNLWYNSNVWKETQDRTFGTILMFGREKQDGTFGIILMFGRKNKIEPLV